MVYYEIYDKDANEIWDVTYYTFAEAYAAVCEYEIENPLSRIEIWETDTEDKNHYRKEV